MDILRLGIGILLLVNVSYCWLPLASEVPVGHSQVELRIRAKYGPSHRTDNGTYRLPKSIAPIHYDLQIRPILDERDIDKYTAPGQVTIRIKCLSPTSSITLHAKQLEISYQNIKIRNIEPAVAVNKSGFNQDFDRDFYTVFVDRDLTVNGEYVLTIPFVAQVASPTERKTGLYRYKFNADDGSTVETNYHAVTQFQKAYAREAFPCFDEPSSIFKSTFSLKVGRKEEDYQSLSNMGKIGDPEAISDLPGWVWDEFSRTVAMPVYTLAFAVVSNYTGEASPEGLSRIPIKTWVPKSMRTEDNLKFAAETAPRMLTFFEELFDFPYMLNKLDNFAADLSLWGMENMGLVVFRPALLLWSEEDDTQFEKWNIATLIAHEIVHMWWGNLVTCEFWSDYWLQEGFARYFQFIGAQFSGVDFRAKDRFVLDVVQWAMAFDEGPDSVPVRNNETARVTYQPFQIEYDKAGALIRMMETFLTHDTFFRALRLYLKRHQYNNTLQDDLFQAMTDQAVEDGTFTQYTVKEIMDTWTTMRGFPIIRVSRADSNRLYISQHRFLVHPSAATTEPGLWYVPIWYITKSKPDFDANNTPPDFWMDKNTVISSFKVTSTDEWLIVNPQARGFYRVIYGDHMTGLLIAQLEANHTMIPFASRSQLLDDYFRAAQARYVSINYALDMTKYLWKEDDLIVWTTFLKNIRPIYSRLVDTSIITTFKKYLLTLILEPLKRIGLNRLPTDSPSIILLRTQLLDWACAVEHEVCWEFSTDSLRKWMTKDSKKIPIKTDVQPQVYCAAIAASNSQKVYEFLVEHYKTTDSFRQKNLVIKALTCNQNLSLLTELIEKTIKENDTDINIVKHGVSILMNTIQNSVGRNYTWQFVKKSHEEITRIHGQMAIPQIIAMLAEYASIRGQIKLDNEIISFVAMYLKQDNITTQVSDSLQASVKNILENTYWMEYFYYDIKQWLNHYFEDLNAQAEADVNG